LGLSPQRIVAMSAESTLRDDALAAGADQFLDFDESRC
jgi:hypothetical protein